MGIHIDRSKCISCGRCRDVCPGNLLRTDETGKAGIRKPGDCWSCASCVKECPVSAISLVLGPEMDGRGAMLSVSAEGKTLSWSVTRNGTTIDTLITNAEEANKY